MIDEHVHPDSIEKHCYISDKYIHKLATYLIVTLDLEVFLCTPFRSNSLPMSFIFGVYYGYDIFRHP